MHPESPSRASRLGRLMPHSLRGQFAAALVAMGALVVAGGVTAVYALRSTGDAAREVSQERLALVETAQELQKRSLQIQLLSDRMVAAESSDAVRRHYDTANAGRRRPGAEVAHGEQSPDRESEPLAR